MTATLNDDPDTLEAILTLATERCSTKSQVLKDNPLIIASLAKSIGRYTACMKLLYRTDYRIELHEEDTQLIKRAL